MKVDRCCLFHIHRPSLKAVLFCSSVLICVSLIPSGASAQTFTSTDLSTLPAGSPGFPPNGTVWILGDSTNFVSAPVTLPVGASGLTINGAGHLLTLNNGSSLFGYFLADTPSPVTLNFDPGNDGLGPVALGRTSETTARLGLKGKWTITTDSGQVWQPYVRANYWSDFGGMANTMFGVDSVPLISHAQYMDVDAGFTTKIDTHLSAFADAGYQFAVSNDGGGKRNGVKGTAGLRYQW